MTELYVSVAGQRATMVRVFVGQTGAWSADVDFESDAPVSGRVVLTIGELELSGTVVPSQSGTFGLQRRVRIVAGAAGWGTVVSAKQFHNDAGVKARAVADDAARTVGETIGTFVPTAERVGRDYVRELGPASRALEDALAGAAWWVDYAGVTQAGPRARVTPDAKTYTVLAFDPRTGRATLAVDDPRAIVVGSVLTVGLDAPITVGELEIVVTADELRVVVGSIASPQLASLFRALVARVQDATLFGTYRYRFSAMDGDRYQLQAVRKGAGLPDVLPVSAWPGVAGVHAVPSPGAEVLVEFIEGDRAMPIVTHFAGKDGTGFVPISLVIGGPTGAPAARQGDPVEILLPPAVFSGTIGGSPASGVLTFTTGSALGTVTGGSAKVKVAS